MLPLLEQRKNCFQTLKTHCKKSYQIIRIRNKNIRISGADKLIIQRNKLKHDIENGQLGSADELNKLEVDISNIIEKEESNKAKLFQKIL